MPRIKYCAGNWKLNKTPGETKQFVEELRSLLSSSSAASSGATSACQMVIFPPAYNLVALKESAEGLPLAFGPQNIYFMNEGAYTGEISPLVAKSIGASFALIGHSERRSIFLETDELCAKKVKAAIDVGLTPMLCVGETLKERESGATENVVLRQLEVGLSLVVEYLVSDSKKPVVIAYEPVWAIGTGKVATPEQAEEVHQFIRQKLCKILNETRAESTSILYGGSVKPDNAAGLAAKPNIDGFLIGGASLKPSDFLSLKGTY